MEVQSLQSSATPSAARQSTAATLAVTVPVADLRREPSNDAELVSQALLNVPAHVLDERAGWSRVRLSDYEGWIATTSLGRQAILDDLVAVVLPPAAHIYAGPLGDATADVAYATSVLPVLSADHSERVQVALPGGSAGWMERTDLALRPAAVPFPPSESDVAVALARRFLDTPYLWGGTTIKGIDCSGLVQLCCRAAGRVIPRDADQQYEGIPYIVERGDLRTGDLIYFAHGGAITHTAMMLDATTYIHAKGSPQSRVMINALEPGAGDYNDALAASLAGARRPFV